MRGMESAKKELIKQARKYVNGLMSAAENCRMRNVTTSKLQSVSARE